jgi:high-affinity iron transporter
VTRFAFGLSLCQGTCVNRRRSNRSSRALWAAIEIVVLFFFSARAASAADSDERRTEAEEIVHLMEYVGADYGGAIGTGVVNEGELEEQLEVLAEAGRVAARLASSPSRRGFDPRAPVDRVRALVAARRPESEVSAAVKASRAEFAAFYDLTDAPREPPSRERGKALFLQHCATCHGEGGRADTPRAAEYTPHPANFHDPAIARALSPLRVFTTVRFGVPKTSMVPFDFLSDAERWDLAFYVSEFDHAAVPVPGEPVRMFDLGELASQSDDELRDALKQAGIADKAVESALADLRLHAPYDPATAEPKGAALRVLRARAGLRKVERRVVRGDHDAAKTHLLSVYLEEVEPLEASLRAADPSLVRELEAEFKELRADIDRRAPDAEIERKVNALSQELGRAGRALGGNGERPSFWGIAISSAGIALREGAEAALLIAALLAVVARAGQSERKRWVHVGWVAAIGCGGLTWIASQRIVEMSGLGRETLEGASAVLAAVVLFYVSYWLFAKREAARWISYLKTKANTGHAAASLFGISFLAVYREAFETIIFYRALVAEPESAPAAGIGALIGVALLVGLVIAYGRAGKFAPPKSFFAFSSLLLYGLSIVFAGQGVAALQTAGVLPLHTVPMPQFPSLGVYATVETYAAQTLLVLLALAAFWKTRSLRAASAVRPPSGPPGPSGERTAG